MDITLPNGVVIQGVPDGTSKEEVKRKAIEKGLATEADFAAKAGDRGALDFLDVGTGLGGALAGAAAGTAILPGVGTVVGGILGGAAGTFGGEVAEDVIAGGNIDLDRATESTATGAAFDLATLGLGKVARPLAKMLGIGVDDVVGKVLPTQYQAYKLGTKESLQQTEKMLAEAGGGLSAQQAGAKGLRKIAEQVGDEGILSGARTRARVERNAEILTNKMQELIDGKSPNFAKSIDDVGKDIYDIVMEGRQATMDMFGKGLDELVTKHGTKRVNTRPVVNAIEQFEKKFASDFGTTLSKETVTELKEIKRIVSARGMTVKGLIDAQKVINQMIRDAGQFGGKKFNSTVEYQLSQLNKQVGDAIEGALKTRGAGGAKGMGEVGVEYSALNKMYGKAMDGLLPSINQNIVKGAKEGDYAQIGKLLVRPSSTSKIDAMMKSIDTAFGQIKAKGVKPTGLKNAEEAKRVIRQSYLAEFFKDVADEGDIYNLAKKATRLSGSGKSETKRLQTILGKDYPQFKALMNAISESKPGTNMGILGLALRSREAGVVTGTALVGGAGFISGIGGAAAVLAVPEVLGRIATNRKAVAKLLDLDKKVKANPNLKPEFVTSAIAKIFEEFDETDRQSLAYSMRENSTGVVPAQPAMPPVDNSMVGDVNQPDAMRQQLGL